MLLRCLCNPKKFLTRLANVIVFNGRSWRPRAHFRGRMTSLAMQGHESDNFTQPICVSPAPSCCFDCPRASNGPPTLPNFLNCTRSWLTCSHCGSVCYPLASSGLGLSLRHLVFLPWVHRARGLSWKPWRSFSVSFLLHGLPPRLAQAPLASSS